MGINPAGFADLFTVRAPTRSLRSNNDIILERPLTKTKLGEWNITIRGAEYWYNLDPTIKHSSSLAQFEKNLKASTVKNNT